MPQEPLSTKPADNRRRTQRRRVLKAGIIAFNNRHSTLPCTVRDVSETGARLLVAGSIDAPDTFELIIELDGIEADCRVVSRTRSEVRVLFVGNIRHTERRRIQVIEPVIQKKAGSLRRKSLASHD